MFHVSWSVDMQQRRRVKQTGLLEDRLAARALLTVAPYPESCWYSLVSHPWLSKVCAAGCPALWRYARNSWPPLLPFVCYPVAPEGADLCASRRAKYGRNLTDL